MDHAYGANPERTTLADVEFGTQIPERNARCHNARTLLLSFSPLILGTLEHGTPVEDARNNNRRCSVGVLFLFMEQIA